MKKYIVTDKHPELKEGIELKKAISDNFVYCHIGSIEHGFNAEEEWVKKGWIREIQEPKWTDEQLKKHLANFIVSNGHLLRNEFVDCPALIDNYMKSIKS